MAADGDPGIALVPCPAVHPDLAPLPAFAAANEDGAAGSVKVALLQRECLADPQPSPPELYVLYDLAAMLVSFPAGALADRVGMTRVLAAGVAFCALAYVGFAATGASVPELALCFVVAGVAIGCVETVQHGAVAVHVESGLRAQSFGVLAGAQAGGQFLASTVAGLLWTALSPEPAMLYATAWMVVSLMSLLAWGRR